jgi:ribose transport system substrate-binding protein
MRIRRMAPLIAVLPMLFIVTACGSSSSSSSTAASSAAGSASTSGSAGTSSADVTAAKKWVAANSSPGSIKLPTQPIKPPTGKTIGIVTCGNAAAACVTGAQAAAKAATALGWKTTTEDGQLIPAKMSAAVQSLIQAKVNGIVLVAIADQNIPDALTAAHNAGIPVVCLFCGNTPTEKVKNPSGANISVDFAFQGQTAGNLIVADSDGKAQVGQITQSVSVPVATRQHGVTEAISKCSGCKIVAEVEENPGGAAIQNAPRVAAQGLLNRFPELTYIAPPSDDEGVGAVQAIQASGRKVHTVGYDCTPQGLSQIRTGTIELGCMTTPLAWGGWGGVDELARMMSGQKPVEEDPSSYLVTKTNLPPAGQPPIEPDFASFYKKLWGVG